MITRALSPIWSWGHEKATGAARTASVRCCSSERASIATPLKARAQAYLGALYEIGEGVGKDLTAAAEWYRKAAEYGNPFGQAAFGAATFYGVGVPANPVEGYVWTKLAAKQGFAKAVSNLPEMFDALTEGQRMQAERRVARFRPKGKGGSDPAFGKRFDKPRRITGPRALGTH